jgi:curli biogenesis system outer membrane secretion channel CsgG
LEGAIDRASKDLINNLPETSRIAVISISSDESDLSALIVDELEFKLVSARKFTIVDRLTLETIRAEQNFQMSGDVSDESAVSVGRILGANIVITGSVTKTDANQRLSIRALDVTTAQIVTMVRETF